MREIINLQIGQCGNSIGSKFWEVLLDEHKIDKEGKYYGSFDKELTKIDSYLDENDSKYYPRAIMIDLEPQTIDELRCSSLSKLYRPDKLISGHTGAQGIWAKGYKTLGLELKDSIFDVIRKSAEECECLEGFQICHSIGGGTGSGLGSLILSELRDQNPTKVIENFTVFPSRSSNIPIEVYNEIFSIDKLTENSDSCVVLDNDSISKDLEGPSYSYLNQIISSAMVGVTSSIRFPCSLNSNWRKTIMNLRPFPRLHFFTISHMEMHNQSPNGEILEFFNWMLSPDNFLLSKKYENHQYIYAASAIFRGNYSEKELEDSIAEIKSNESSWFVNWIPNNFLCESCQVPPVNSMASASSILNGNYIANIFKEIGEIFCKLFRKKRFIRSYTEEGMDLMDFTEAESNISDLVSEYSAWWTWDNPDDTD